LANECYGWSEWKLYLFTLDAPCRVDVRYFSLGAEIFPICPAVLTSVYVKLTIIYGPSLVLINCRGLSKLVFATLYTIEEDSLLNAHLVVVQTSTDTKHFHEHSAMEDLPSPSDAVTRGIDLPEQGNDLGDPLNPDIEEENSTPNPPASFPAQDMEVTGENEVDKDDPSDNESVLSEVDEAQFEDFDPTAIAIEDRPAIAVDETNVNLIGVHKRKRTEDGEGAAKKKKKEGRREKVKKSRKKRNDEEDFVGGEEIDGKRTRKKGSRSKRVTPEGDSEDENLTPDESMCSTLTCFSSKLY
jgi:hypothetical protein